MSDIGKKLKQARDARSHSQPEAASEIGCSVDAVRHWESGRREPRGLYRQALETYIQQAESTREA